MYMLQNGLFGDDPSTLAQGNQARFPIYLNKPSITLVCELGRHNAVF